MTIAEYKETMRGKRVDVVGIGISNTPLIRWLLSIGADVCAHDRKGRGALGPVCAELESLGARLSLGPDYLSDLDGDVIFRTPGLRYDTPELLQASSRGAQITSEIETFFALRPARRIIGVTGSDGKTTTTTLICEILKHAGYVCHLGGNIGDPLLYRIETVHPDDVVVLELSSFQLQTMQDSPDVAVVTNLSPNHLDVHKSYGEYIDAKKNIFLHQTAKGRVVLNADNEQTKALAALAPGRATMFSRRGEADVSLRDGTICLHGEPILAVSDIRIPGWHNVENYMAAIGATEGLVRPEDVVAVAKSFGGVPHRIELVRTYRGVRYYNSSIDSSPNRTKNTLNVFDDRVILIAGGKDKGIPYDEMGKLIADKVKILILIGATSGPIAKALWDEIRRTGAGRDVVVYREATYEDVVRRAQRVAKEGDVVLLSPASTSFDMFRNFEERGERFRRLVNRLP